MIRLAFLGVILIGGLIAFGAFSLVRGTGGGSAQVLPAAAEPAVVQPEAEPEVAQAPSVEEFYFLQDLDFTAGEPGLVFFNDTGEPLLVRDPVAVSAARDQAFINSIVLERVAANAPPEIAIGMSPKQAVGFIFLNDTLTHRIMCIERDCDSADTSGNVALAGLLDSAVPIQRISDQFDTYDDYIATIDAITRDPNYMFLHARPDQGFPLPRSTPSMQIELPTIIALRTEPFDVTAHEILVTTALLSALPEGASLRSVAVTDIGTGVIADGDNNAPVLAGGAPINYPDVGHYAVSAWVDGVATLDDRLLDTLAVQTTNQIDFTPTFATFVRERLQSSCADCFVVLVEGGVKTDARIVQSNRTTYPLEYFDLRDTP